MDIQRNRKNSSPIAQQLKREARLNNHVNHLNFSNNPIFLKECQENHIIRMRKHYISQSTVKIKPWERIKSKYNVPSRFRLCEKPTCTKSFQKLNNLRTEVVPNRLSRHISQNTLRNKQKPVATPSGVLKKRNPIPIKASAVRNQSFTKTILKGCTQQKQEKNDEAIKSFVINSKGSCAVMSNYISNIKNIENSNKMIIQNTRNINVDLTRSFVNTVTNENLQSLYRRTDKLYASLNEIIKRMNQGVKNAKMKPICKSDKHLEIDKSISTQICSKEDICQLFQISNNMMPIIKTSSDHLGNNMTYDSDNSDESDEDIQDNEVHLIQSSNAVNLQPIRTYLTDSSFSRKCVDNNDFSEENLARINRYKRMLNQYYKQDVIFKETKSVGCFPSRLTPMNQPFHPIKPPCLLGLNRFMDNNPHFTNQNNPTTNSTPVNSGTKITRNQMNPINLNFYVDSLRASRDEQNAQTYNERERNLSNQYF